MLSRVGIWTALVAFVAAFGFGALGTFGVGLDEPPPRSDDISQRIIDGFEEYEAWYLQWGRWEDLALAVGFAGLLVAAPFLPGASRGKHVLVAGAGFAALGELIDLSKLAALEVGRIGLDTGLEAEFSSGNTFRYAIDTTSIYVWVAGLLLLGIGLLVAGKDSDQSRWRNLTYLLGGAVLAWTAAIVNNVSGPWPDTILPETTHTIFTITVVIWAISTTRLLGTSDATTRT